VFDHVARSLTALPVQRLCAAPERSIVRVSPMTNVEPGLVALLLALANARCSSGRCDEPVTATYSSCSSVTATSGGCRGGDLVPGSDASFSVGCAADLALCDPTKGNTPLMTCTCELETSDAGSFAYWNCPCNPPAAITYSCVPQVALMEGCRGVPGDVLGVPIDQENPFVRYPVGCIAVLPVCGSYGIRTCSCLKPYESLPVWACPD
jgi:hypothetical protein